MRWQFYYERAFFFYYPTIIIQADKDRSVIYLPLYCYFGKLPFCTISLNIQKWLVLTAGHLNFEPFCIEFEINTLLFPNFPVAFNIDQY